MNLFHPRFAPRQNSSNSRQRSTWLALAIATSCQLYASSVVRSGDPTFHSHRSANRRREPIWCRDTRTEDVNPGETSWLGNY